MCCRPRTSPSTAPMTAIWPSASPGTGRTMSYGSPGAPKPIACSSAFPSTSRRARRGAAQELVNLINQRVWLGHFEVWADDGEVVFRHAMALPEGDRPSMAQTASMIDAAMESADRFYPAFDFLIAGGKSPAEAMTACMFETVGQA